MKTNDIRITLPASKSMSNRWLMINHVTGGHFRINKLSTSNDTRLMRDLLTQIETKSSNVYYCDNAGSVARFLMPLLSITPGNHVLTGDERLRQRPMAPLIDALRSMGFRIECTENEGFLPVYIHGGVPNKRTVSVDPLLSSQFVSSLLLIAPCLAEGISLTMTQRPTSRPYIEMTCDALRQAGIEVRRSSNGRTYYVQPFTGKPKPATISIERDCRRHPISIPWPFCVPTSASACWGCSSTPVRVTPPPMPSSASWVSPPPRCVPPTAPPVAPSR